MSILGFKNVRNNVGEDEEYDARYRMCLTSKEHIKRIQMIFVTI